MKRMLVAIAALVVMGTPAVAQAPVIVSEFDENQIAQAAAVVGLEVVSTPKADDVIRRVVVASKRGVRIMLEGSQCATTNGVKRCQVLSMSASFPLNSPEDVAYAEKIGDLFGFVKASVGKERVLTYNSVWLKGGVSFMNLLVVIENFAKNIDDIAFRMGG